jgi:hypothetical protein
MTSLPTYAWLQVAISWKWRLGGPQLKSHGNPFAGEWASLGLPELR